MAELIPGKFKTNDPIWNFWSIHKSIAKQVNLASDPWNDPVIEKKKAEKKPWKHPIRYPTICTITARMLGWFNGRFFMTTRFHNVRLFSDFGLKCILLEASTWDDDENIMFIFCRLDSHPLRHRCLGSMPDSKKSKSQVNQLLFPTRTTNGCPTLWTSWENIPQAHWTVTVYLCPWPSSRWSAWPSIALSFRRCKLKQQFSVDLTNRKQ